MIATPLLEMIDLRIGLVEGINSLSLKSSSFCRSRKKMPPKVGGREYSNAFSARVSGGVNLATNYQLPITNYQLPITQVSVAAIK